MTETTDSRDAEIARLRGWLQRISLAPNDEGQLAACALLGAPVPASMAEAQQIAGIVSND